MDFLDGSVGCEDHSDVSFLANLRNLPLKSTNEILLMFVLGLQDSRTLITDVNVWIVSILKLRVTVRIRSSWGL